MPTAIRYREGPNGDDNRPARRAPSWRLLDHPAAVERGLLVTMDLLLVLPLLLVTTPGLAAVVVVAAIVAWGFKGLHRRRISMSLLDDMPALAGGIAVALAVTVPVGLAFRSVSAFEVIAMGVVLLASTSAMRATGYHLIRRLRASRKVAYRSLIIGSGGLAQLLADRMADHPESGLQLVGSVARQGSRSPRDVPYLGDPVVLPPLVREHGVDVIVVGYGSLRPFDLMELTRTCQPLGVEILVIPRFFELGSLHGRQDCLWDVPLLRVNQAAPRILTWRLKRLFDVATALLALLLLAPVMLLTAAAVRVELGPGILFKQIRIGRDGQHFSLLKFRSMRPPPQGADSPWSVTSGDRVGRVGRFIRRFSLDELPQFLNVLRGEMSIVGPRPERPDYVVKFSASVPRYGHRHRVPVGLTGLAAVNGLRGDTSIRDRAQFDNWYIDNWSLWLDVKIMLRTVTAILRGTGG